MVCLSVTTRSIHLYFQIHLVGSISRVENSKDLAPSQFQYRSSEHTFSHVLISVLFASVRSGSETNMASSVKTASFLGLPTELRSQIMDYLLPRWSRQERTLRLLPVMQVHQRDLYYKREKVPIWIPPMVSLQNATEDLLFLNRQIHSEALGRSTLQSFVPHQLNINDESYWCNAPEEMVEAATDKMTYDVEQLFPASNLSKVPGLIIDIKPTDFPGFWTCLSITLESLCNGRLLQQTPIKKLTVRLHDMMHTCAWDTKYSRNWEHPFQYGRPVEACFVDYQSALHPLLALAGKVIRLEIELPYWMKFAEHRKRMREDMSKRMLTDTVFVFAPRGDGIVQPPPLGPLEFSRRKHSMAALAKEEAKRAEAGMVERTRHPFSIGWLSQRVPSQPQGSWYY